jgi:hypothetical protein
MNRDTYLLQRFYRRKTPIEKAKGLDKHFCFDYMGSAEFEWGQLPSALAAMRENKGALLKEPEKIVSGKHTCWFIGASKYIDVAKELFEDQLHSAGRQRKWILKESSGIAQAYGTDKDFPDGYKNITGWWDVTLTHGTIPWLLFKFKEDAELWLKEM